MPSNNNQTLDDPKEIVCIRCKGNGRVFNGSSSSVTCPICGGDGKMLILTANGKLYRVLAAEDE